MHFGCLFRCMVFRNVMTGRKVAQNMVVSQEWPLRYRSYDRFMGMLRMCVESSNDDALLLLGLVKTQIFFFS
jgi:hypothetical protein